MAIKQGAAVLTRPLELDVQVSRYAADPVH